MKIASCNYIYARILWLYILVCSLNIAVGSFSFVPGTPRELQLPIKKKPCADGYLNNDNRYSEDEKCTEYAMGDDKMDTWSPVETFAVVCHQRLKTLRMEYRCKYKNYCVNPITKKPNLNLLTVEVKRMMPFCVTTADGIGYIKYEEVSVGCICVFPGYTA